MKPIKQRFRHDPENNVWGDCHRAAIASILELPLDDVPHFAEDGANGTEMAAREREFLASRGLIPISVAFRDTSLDDVLMTMENLNPGTHFILGGESKNGCGHSVVACGGHIVHDPALDESGIIGPMEDGHYWVTYFGAGVAANV